MVLFVIKDHSEVQTFSAITSRAALQLAARDRLHVVFHRQDNTYHSICYTSYGALAGTHMFLTRQNIHIYSYELQYHIKYGTVVIVNVSY